MAPMVMIEPVAYRAFPGMPFFEEFSASAAKIAPHVVMADRTEIPGVSQHPLALRGA